MGSVPGGGGLPWPADPAYMADLLRDPGPGRAEGALAAARSRRLPTWGAPGSCGVKQHGLDNPTQPGHQTTQTLASVQTGDVYLPHKQTNGQSPSELSVLRTASQEVPKGHWGLSFTHPDASVPHPLLPEREEGAPWAPSHLQRVPLGSLPALVSTAIKKVMIKHKNKNRARGGPAVAAHRVSRPGA